MKKIIVMINLLLVVSIIAGCTIKKENIKSVKNSSVTRVVDEVCSEAKHEKNTSSEAETKTPVDTSDKPPAWSGKRFEYKRETCENLDLFVDWIKENGKTEINGKRYDTIEYNQKFLKSIANIDEIILPVISDNSFKFEQISVFESGYSVNYSTYSGENSNSYKMFDIAIYQGKEAYNSVLEGISKFPTASQYKKSNTLSKWGEYYYCDYKANGDEIQQIPSAFFLYKGTLVNIAVYGKDRNKQFDPKYFNYFDFETVSLKD